MVLRSFWWQKRNASSYKYYKNKILRPDQLYFKYGNAGDMFNIDLLKFVYNIEPVNITNEGKRLLLIGSVMNEVKKGDIINGIGWKGNNLMHRSEILSSLKIYGVRGPLTKSLFEKCGADLSDLKFEYDPGLLIREVYDIDLSKAKEKQVIFIPHFRDQWTYKGKYPKGIKGISIDNRPRKIASEILKSKLVYTSSLHGIIFSHALNKPCVFVKPQSDEPLFKYRDYFLSVDLEYVEPLESIYAANFFRDVGTTINNYITLEDFYFPSVNELIKKQIIE